MGEAICITSLITGRVNQACSLSVTELRETPGDNQKGRKRRRRRRRADMERREKGGCVQELLGIIGVIAKGW